jgi:hypothetical protein
MMLVKLNSSMLIIWLLPLLFHKIHINCKDTNPKLQIFIKKLASFFGYFLTILIINVFLSTI